MKDTFSRLKLSEMNITTKVITADVQDSGDWFDGKPFDRILLDAPCSATGVIRKNPDILFHRREHDIRMVTRTQSELLDMCWELLAVGGRMLYATCSVLPDENIKQIESFLERTNDAKICPLGHNRAVKTQLGTLQFLPDENGDGFFYALLEKQNS